MCAIVAQPGCKQTCLSDSFAYNIAGYLLLAVKENRFEDVRHIIVDHKVDVDTKFPPYGQPAINIAIDHGHWDTLVSLIEVGSSVNQPDAAGNTPLHNAVANNRLNIVRRLLAERANLNKPNRSGWFPLHLAVSTRIDIRIMKELVDAAALIDCIGPGGETPLLMSCSQALKRHMLLLLESGASVTHSDHKGRGPLHFVGGRLFPEVVDALIVRKIPLNARDCFGSTPLSCLVDTMPEPSVAQKLINFGANPNIADNLSYTPLHLSLNYCPREISELLIRNGADVNLKDKFGDTPLHYAASNNNLSSLDLLIKAGSDIQRESWILNPTANENDIQPETLKWLTQQRELCVPRCLKALSRLAIRRSVGLLTERKIGTLDCLPQSLKQYLLLNDNSF